MPVTRAISILGLMACAWSWSPLTAQATLPDTAGFIDVEGARLFFRSVGAGTPLLVVHGGPGMSHDYLAPQLVDLLADRYRLIFYDQRASGRSTGAEDTTRLTMAQFVEDLEGVRTALGLDEVNLMGHSFGGLLAMYHSVAYPDAVANLLLVDTSPASWELNFPYFRRTIAERQTEDDREQLAALEGPANNGSPEAMERYLRIFFRTFFHDRQLSDSLHLGITEQWLVNNRVTGDRIWADLGTYDLHDRLPLITARTLIIHGTESVIALEGAEAIEGRIPNASLVVLQDVGHFPYIESPRDFKDAILGFIR